jgi:2,4-dichlorophenol 6-monooxygenase
MFVATEKRARRRAEECITVSAAPDLEVDVLIVGGGGAGLTASMLLSRLGVDSLLVSSLPTTSILPKAHILNQRAMEILADCGVAEAVYAAGTPPEQFAASGVYAGFSGHPLAGRLLGKIECWGGGGANADWVAASPRLTTNLPQIRLEPILRDGAEALAPGRVRFHHEVTEFAQDDDGVTAVVHDHDARYTVRARYLMACDGGRTIGRALGVQMVGLKRLASQVSLHISADLSQWATDPDVLLRWVFMPQLGAMVVMAPMGPTRWGPDSEEWVVHFSYRHDDVQNIDDARAEADMRAALGIGDHPVTVHLVSRWALDGVVADRFTHGRIFLFGDAAHPPTGGLGLTSAMHDVHNFCWKVAAVLRGEAGPALLDTYESERRPAVERNVQRALENGAQWTVTGQELGVYDPAATPDERWARLARTWSDDPADDAWRRHVAETLAAHSMEFQEQNVEYGAVYASPTVVPDGTDPAPNPDPIRIYQPSTRPGHPLPHAWVDGIDGTQVSTLDLVRPGRFLLIAGEEGQSWCDAALEAGAELGVPIDAVRIGLHRGDWLDPRCSWLRRREFTATGAVLVRPDRYVGWRSMGASDRPGDELGRALAAILQRG